MLKAKNANKQIDRQKKRSLDLFPSETQKQKKQNRVPK